MPKKIVTKALFGLSLLIAVYVGIVIGYNLKSPETTQKTVAKKQATSVAKKPDIYGLWISVNEQRASLGLPSLLLDPGLNASASAKCDDMAKKDYWSHDTPTGVEPWSFISRYDGAHAYEGENLQYGMGYTNSRVVGAWMHSAEHKENIANSHYSHVGYAVCVAHNYQGHTLANIVVQHLTSN